MSSCNKKCSQSVLLHLFWVVLRWRLPHGEKGIFWGHSGPPVPLTFCSPSIHVPFPFLFLWTLFMDAFSGHFLWTLLVDTFYWNFLLTILWDTFCGQYLWTLFVKTLCTYWPVFFIFKGFNCDYWNSYNKYIPSLLLLKNVDKIIFVFILCPKNIFIVCSEGIPVNNRIPNIVVYNFNFSKSNDSMLWYKYTPSFGPVALLLNNSGGGANSHPNTLQLVTQLWYIRRGEAAIIQK